MPHVRLGKGSGVKCKCCGTPFDKASGPLCEAARTRGHLRPKRAVTNFGPPELQSTPVDASGRDRLWIWQCRRCNNDQGNLNLRQWHYHLRGVFDPRAERVCGILYALYLRGYKESEY